MSSKIVAATATPKFWQQCGSSGKTFGGQQLGYTQNSSCPVYRVVQNILANIPHLQGCTKHFRQYPNIQDCTKHFSQFPTYAGLYQIFQPISYTCRVVPNILANIPHIQGCFSQYAQLQGCTRHLALGTSFIRAASHLENFPPCLTICTYYVVQLYQVLGKLESRTVNA